MIAVVGCTTVCTFIHQSTGVGLPRLWLVWLRLLFIFLCGEVLCTQLLDINLEIEFLSHGGLACHLFFIAFFYYFICGCFDCMYVCVLCACLLPMEAREGISASESRVMGCCKLLCGSWELNLGPVKAASALSHWANPPAHLSLSWWLCSTWS